MGSALSAGFSGPTWALDLLCGLDEPHIAAIVDQHSFVSCAALDQDRRRRAIAHAGVDDRVSGLGGLQVREGLEDGRVRVESDGLEMHGGVSFKGGWWARGVTARVSDQAKSQDYGISMKRRLGMLKTDKSPLPVSAAPRRVRTVSPLLVCFVREVCLFASFASSICRSADQY